MAEIIGVRMVLGISGQEVLRRDPVPQGIGRYRESARFININERHRQILIRHIMQSQRDHLSQHYGGLIQHLTVWPRIWG
jgi:hypothetical protein